MNISTTRCRWIVILIFASTALIAVQARGEDNVYKLKSGAKGEICLKCHESFQEKLKDRFVHTPVKIGECSGCHNPHTSPHGDLLDTFGNEICYGCHKKTVPAGARSVHEVVVRGNCVTCHDSHSSNNKFILHKAGNDLCFECHSDIGEKLSNIRFKHKPVSEGCTSCHNPHASGKYASLLKDDVPRLCIKCHEIDKPAFKREHMNYPVADSMCNDCHDSHGSNRRVIMYDNVHLPVAEKKCAECHARPDAKDPTAIKNAGVDLCRECHKEMVDQTFSKKRVHWPLYDKEGCLNCHNAHAARQAKLLSGSIRSVCGECHADTVKLQNISISNPENDSLCKPVREGNCIDCHDPHAADKVLLIAEETISFDVCNKCHEWQTHSTHPIGEKVIDPRNKNLITDCLSCHRACGTANNPVMSQFETTTETCVQCHEELRR